jgi:hypothetical protein
MREGGESIKQELAAVEEDIKRLERREEESMNEQLQLDDELSIKARLADREILESQGKKSEEDQEESAFRPSLNTLPHQEVSLTQNRDYVGASGMTPEKRIPPISAVSLQGIARELIGRSILSSRMHKIEREGKTSSKTMFEMMWATKQWNTGRHEHMMQNLSEIEGRTRKRIESMNHLNRKKAAGGLSEDDERELKRLQREEAHRYWLRQNKIGELPLHDQERLNWLRPIGDGAYGVLPVTVVTTWDQLTKSQKAGVRWYYDNLLLRWQRGITSKFMPKKAKMSWFKRKKQRGVEKLFDDMDEEIYCDKKFLQMVKKGQAELEDMEEELRGYDRFTVEEEKQIKKMVAEIMKEELALAKEKDLYS